MNSKQTELTDALVAELKKGDLSAQELRDGIAAVAAADETRQDLLYLHSRSSSPSGTLLGMSLFADGEEQEVDSDPETWPYKSVLDAMSQGWRVISFPDMSLMSLNDDEMHSLGFLFVLERWR